MPKEVDAITKLYDFILWIIPKYEFSSKLFNLNLEKELITLQKEMQNMTYRPGW